jgi:hypothetical protein
MISSQNGRAAVSADKNSHYGAERKKLLYRQDGNRLTYRYAGNEPFLPYLSDTDVWTPANLIYWFDRKLQQPDIPQPEMLEWLRRNIEYLTDTRKITLANLMIAAYW